MTRRLHDKRGMDDPFPEELNYSPYLSEYPKKEPRGKMMVDPFEVRMRFTTQLQHLSASVTSSQKAAHYALKYRDLDEDLHSCILEQIERVGCVGISRCDIADLVCTEQHE